LRSGSALLKVDPGWARDKKIDSSNLLGDLLHEIKGNGALFI